MLSDPSQHGQGVTASGGFDPEPIVVSAPVDRDDSAAILVPGLTSLNDSITSEQSQAFADTVAAVLSRLEGYPVALQEAATRVTGTGEHVQFAYFTDSEGRLFIESAGPDLFDTTPELVGQLTPGPHSLLGAT